MQHATRGALIVGGGAALAFVVGLVVAAGPWVLPFPGIAALAAGAIVALLVPLLLRLRVKAFAAPVDPRRWVTARTPLQKLDPWARGLGVAAWVASVAFRDSVGHASGGFAWVSLALPAFLVGAGALGLTLFAMGARLLRGDADAPAITLDASTLTVNGSDGMHVVAYADVRALEGEGSTLWLVTAERRWSVVVEPGAAFDVDALEAAIRAAKEADEERRAAPEPALDRATGMPVKEWIDRLDALAAARKGASAYRSADGLDDATLWATLDDEEASPERRAAAARLLARSSSGTNTAQRIAATTTRIADDVSRLRIEAALAPEADDAAALFEAADVEEMKRAQR